MKIRKPKILENASFDTFLVEDKAPELADNKKKCNDFANNFTTNSGKNLIFSGNVGTGKTHLAYAISTELEKRRCSCAYYTIPDIINEFKQRSLGSFDRYDHEILNDKTNADFLILDELGTMVLTEFAFNALGQLIDQRYNSMKSTLIISNLDIKDIQKIIGLRAYDRLRGNGLLIKFKGESRR